MAGPVAGFVQLPTDSGNAGKKIQTQSEIIGADTVHSHYFVQRSRRKIVGVYLAAATGAVSVQATAQNGTSTGHFWFEVPTGASIHARIRKFEITYDWGVVPAADVTTLPRTALTRFTFTGAASGASITPARRKSDDAANVGNVRTAVTGMTVTVGAVAWMSLAPFVDFATAVGINMSARNTENYEPLDEEAFLDIAPGEGVLLYQPDAGTASDLRRFGWILRWDEYDSA